MLNLIERRINVFLKDLSLAYLKEILSQMVFSFFDSLGLFMSKNHLSFCLSVLTQFVVTVSPK